MATLPRLMQRQSVLARGLLWIETASKHCCLARPMSGRPRNEGVHPPDSCRGARECVRVRACVWVGKSLTLQTKEETVQSSFSPVCSRQHTLLQTSHYRCEGLKLR